MITRYDAPRLLGTALIIICLSICATSASAQRISTQRHAAENPHRAGSAFAQDRIDLSHIRPASTAPVRPTAIRNRTVSPVQQASFSGGMCDNCGPVCDCAGASCGVEYIEPTCGCGAIGPCDCGLEPGCGMEISEPICGFESSCGVEPSCGCGLSGACGCGIEVFPSCGCEIGECTCGVEFVGPTCGMEPDCGCDACSSVCLPNGIDVFLPYLKIDWCRFDLFAGVAGFTGPMNCVSTNANNPNNLTATGGSFGFYEGFNEGRDLRRLLGFDISSQLGLRATQSHLSGGKLTDETRHQIFLTAGLFRRVDYGLQYGIAVDYLNEDWYFQGDLVQIRTEISWNNNNCDIFGAELMTGTGTDSSTTDVIDASGAAFSSTVEFEVLDQYRAFYRRILDCGGDWDVFLGGTGEKDFVIGSRVNMPLSSQVVFNSGVTYVSPDDEGIANPHLDEAWNISLGFTYRPGGSVGCGRYCRPMFGVADNGTFVVRRR